MISMISSTSITSISGVVLMSTITSGSSPDAPTFIAMMVPRATRAWRHLQVGPRGGGSVMKATLTMPARWQSKTTRPTNS